MEVTQKRDLILLLTCNSMFSSFGKKMSDERMCKVGQNISDSFLSSELAHTRFIYYKFNNSDIYSHLRAFCTYLYFYENIDSIDNKFFDKDIEQIVYNFWQYAHCNHDITCPQNEYHY